MVCKYKCENISGQKILCFYTFSRKQNKKIVGLFLFVLQFDSSPARHSDFILLLCRSFSSTPLFSLHYFPQFFTQFNFEEEFLVYSGLSLVDWLQSLNLFPILAFWSQLLNDPFSNFHRISDGLVANYSFVESDSSFEATPFISDIVSSVFKENLLVWWRWWVFLEFRKSTVCNIWSGILASVSLNKWT